MSDSSGLDAQNDALLRHEQLETCIKNLFEVPSKNIESAFGLILGMIRDQSMQIDDLKRAQDESSEESAKIRLLMKQSLDQQAKENEVLSNNLEKLKQEHHDLIRSLDQTSSKVSELSEEVETLVFNFLGEEQQPDDDSEDSTSSEGCDVQLEHTGNDSEIAVEAENDNEPESATDVEKDQSTSSRNLGLAGRVGFAKVKVAKVKFNADRTVAARLDWLEQSFPSLAESKADREPAESHLTDKNLEEISSRIHAVEAFLHGFHKDDNVESIGKYEEEDDVGEGDVTVEPRLTEGKHDGPATVSCPSNDEETVGSQIQDDEEEGSEVDPPNRSEQERNGGSGISDSNGMSDEVSATRHSSSGDDTLTSHHSEPSHRSMPLQYDVPQHDNLPHQPRNSRNCSRRGSLLFHLKDIETRTGTSIEDLSDQISTLRQSIQEQQATPVRSLDPEEVRTQVAVFSDGLKRQLDDVISSIGSKVSNEDFEAKMEEMSSILNEQLSREPDNVSASSSVDTNVGLNTISDDLSGVKKHILEQICKLETSKVDKDTLKEQLEQIDVDLKALLEQEISKQQLTISTNKERANDEMQQIKSIIEAQMKLRYESPVPFEMDSSMKENDVNERIQQATDALRASLEERLDELGSIEGELDGLASRLAEKPSQDQIDSMLCDLEKRLGHDESLQIILANMKIELRQRMTRAEVVALVKHTFKEAKLGIQNTKDTLMIGRIPYCLGCSKPFPAGVTGMRAPKMNHDSLPPAQGLVSNATLYGTGSRKSLRPLQALRSAPQRPRPKSAIVGKFSPASACFSVRNNSR